MLRIAHTAGNAILSALPSNDTLNIYDLSLTGVLAPNRCEDVATGTLLVTYTLASPWALTPSGGQMSLNGLPLTATCLQTGNPAYFRFLSSGTCNLQGTIGLLGTLDPNGLPWDLTLSSVRFTAAQVTTLAHFPIVAVNDD
jgi:hypothetical protein